MKKRNIIIAAITLSLIGAAVLGACSYNYVGDKSSGVTSYSTEDCVEAEYSSEDFQTEEYSEPITQTSDNATTTSTDAEKISFGQKLIKDVNVTIETTDPTQTLEVLQAKTLLADGYVEYSYVTSDSGHWPNSDTTTGYVTLRIPAEQYDSFMKSIGDCGTIIYESSSVQDVTSDYMDSESRVSNLKAEEERLQTLLEKAESLDEIFLIEDKLSDIRSTIEYYESSLQYYDSQTAYSTFSIELKQPDKATNHIPAILIYAVLLLIVLKVLKTLFKKVKTISWRKKPWKTEES